MSLSLRIAANGLEGILLMVKTRRGNNTRRRGYCGEEQESASQTCKCNCPATFLQLVMKHNVQKGFWRGNTAYPRLEVERRG